MSDIRLDVDFDTHPKIIKLKRRMGDAGLLCLIRLWCYAARHRSHGILEGMDAEDIAIACGWTGNEQEFVATLEQLRLLDPHPSGAYALHHWEQRNPWAANAEARSDLARKAITTRWDKRKNTESIRNVYAPNTEQIRNVYAPNTEQIRNVYAPNDERNTPSPSPSPTPPPPPQPTVGTETTPESERHATRDPVNGNPVNGVNGVGGGGEEENPEPREPRPSPPATREDETRKPTETTETQTPSPEALIWPERLAAEERQPMHDLLALSPPALAQALLDELAASLTAGKVKTSPIGYLRGLLKRAGNGTFIPEAGLKIAQDRERRRQAESALKAALERPPVATQGERERREGMHHVAERMAVLYAALGRHRPQTEEKNA